jgi:hypothetical protein
MIFNLQFLVVLWSSECDGDCAQGELQIQEGSIDPIDSEARLHDLIPGFIILYLIEVLVF